MEPHFSDRVDQILEEEELHVASETLEQREEIRVARKRVFERTARSDVVKPDGLEGQIESIPDQRMGATSLVDRLPAVDSISGKDEPAADGGAQAVPVPIGIAAHCAVRVVKTTAVRVREGVAGQNERPKL